MFVLCVKEEMEAIESVCVSCVMFLSVSNMNMENDAPLPPLKELLNSLTEPVSQQICTE